MRKEGIRDISGPLKWKPIFFHPQTYPDFLIPFLTIERKVNNEWIIAMKSFGTLKTRRAYAVQIRVESTNPEIDLSFTFGGTANDHNIALETLERSAKCLVLSHNQTKNIKCGHDYFSYHVSIKEKSP